MVANSQWSVACGDPFGRHRGMTVYATGGDVVVVSPPGQSAVLSLPQTREFDQALCWAAADVIVARGTADNDTPLHAISR